MYINLLDTFVRFVPIGNINIQDLIICNGMSDRKASALCVTNRVCADMYEYTMLTRKKTILNYAKFWLNARKVVVAAAGDA